MPTVLIQAGHYPNAGGAPGEAAWTYQLAQMLAARLQAAGVACTVVGDFYGKAPPPACAQDWDLFLALHYDAAIYAARGERNSGCFADRGIAETRPAQADRFIGIWELTYPLATGIPLANWRRNANTNQYYAFAALTDATPGVIVEHGCGAEVPTGGYPAGDDATILHARIDLVADADTAAILAYFGVGAQPHSQEATFVTDPERQQMQAQIDSLNGVNTELAHQLDAVRTMLADANSTIGALEHDVIPALQAAGGDPAAVEEARSKLERIKEIVEA